MIRALPGRIVVLYPLNPITDQIIQVPNYVKRKEEAVMGVALETRKSKVLSSGYPGIPEGLEVYVRCDAACLALDHQDYAWIPEGHEVRIFGVHEAVLNDEQDVVFGVAV